MNNLIKVYAAYCKNEELRLTSSSGGMFSVIANYVFKNNGVVYGVVMSDDCYSAVYKRIDSVNDLSTMRGSKYLQAKVGDTFHRIKRDLDCGKNVLFTGTGCYINGLNSYLQRKYDNLLCMDIVCHGTPSPKLWKKYAKYQESKFKSKIIYVSFRNKDKHDWNGFEMKEIDNNYNELYISRHIDPYFSMFVKNIALRPSCFECTAKYYKLSDITVADFWGIDSVAPELNDNKGISLVIIRSKKGQELFDTINQELIFKEVSYEDSVKENKSEYQSYLKPKEREQFFVDMNKLSFEKLTKKYVTVPIWKNCGRKVKHLIQKLWGVTDKKIQTHEDYGLLLKLLDSETSPVRKK